MLPIPPSLYLGNHCEEVGPGFLIVQSAPSPEAQHAAVVVHGKRGGVLALEEPEAGWASGKDPAGPRTAPSDYGKGCSLSSITRILAPGLRFKLQGIAPRAPLPKTLASMATPSGPSSRASAFLLLS